MIPDAERDFLDKKIIQLQKSTRTTVPVLLPLHDILRQKYRWYYNWSAFKYSKAIHVLFLIGFMAFLGAVFYRINISEPSRVFAATADVDFAPNAAGDLTQWSGSGSIGCGSANWCVTTTNDADTSYVTNYFGGQSDLYNITNSSQSGVINSVSVYFVAKYGSTAGVNIRSALKTGGSLYYGAVHGLSASYTTYSDTWASNPQTSVDWTWSDVDNLQIGLFAQTDGYSYVTQVYVRVNYSSLDPPTAAYVDTATTTALTVHWTDNSSNETGFKIDQQNNCSGSWTLVYTGVTVNENSHAIGSLTANNSYCFRVYAYRGTVLSTYTNTGRGQTLATKLLPSTTGSNLEGATTFRMQGTTTQMTADKAAGSSAATIGSAGANATYTNDSGNIITVENSDKARIEKVSTTDIAQNPGGAARIEEARTNLLTYSSFEAGSNPPTGWINALLTSSTAATGIHGTNYANLVTNGAGYNALYQGVTGGLTSGTTYTLSVYAQYVSGYNGNFSIGVSGTCGDFWSTGNTVSSGSWQRITKTFTATATGACNAYIEPTLSTASAATFKVDAIQLEAGGFATSYIPTVAAAVTRNAEKVQYANTSNLTAGSGTISAWVKPEWASTDTNTRGNDYYGTIFDSGYGTANSLLFTFYTPNNTASNRLAIFKQGGTNDYTTCLPSFTANSWHHAALTYATGQPLKIYWDGALCATTPGNANAVPTTGNMTLGKYDGYVNPNSYFNGLISDFTIFNTALAGEKVKGVYQGYAPSDINVSNADTTQLKVNWTVNSSDATNLHLERQASCTGSWSNVSTSIGGNDANYTDATVSSNTSYCYRVHAAKTSAPDSGYVYTVRGQTLANKLKPSAALEAATTFRMQASNADLNPDKGSGAATITNSGANATYTNDAGNILKVDSGNLKGRIEKVSTTDIAQNPGGAVRIEEARTNSALYTSLESWSTNLPTGWINNAGTPGTDYQEDQTSANVIHNTSSIKFNNGSASYTGIDRSLALASATYTASIWVKGSNVPAGKNVLLARSTGSVLRTVALPSGTYGWTRVSVTFTGDTDTVFVVLDSNSGMSGANVWFDAYQLEAGGFATSYIPTTTAAAARSAETLSYASASNASADAGTVSVWIKPEWASTSTTQARYFVWASGTTAGDMGLGWDGAGNFRMWVYNGGWQSASKAATFSADTWIHLAATWDKTSGAQIYVNGVAGTAYSGTWTPGSSAASFYVGRDYVASLWSNGLLSDFTISNYTWNALGVRIFYSGYGPTISSGTADSATQITWSVTNWDSNGTSTSYQHKQTTTCTNDDSGYSAATNPDTGLSGNTAYCFQAQRTVSGGATSLYNVSSSAVTTQISLSGNIYQSGSESSLDNTAYTIAASVNNGAPVTTTAGSGTYTLGFTGTAGQVIAVYIQGHANNANTFTVTDGTTAITSLNLYVNKVAVGNDNGTGTTTNVNICTQTTYPAAGDRLITCSGNNLTIATNDEFHVLNGKLYDTGASATLTTQGTGALHPDTGATATISTTNSTIAGAVTITGTLVVGTNLNLNVGGAFTDNGTFTANSGSTVTLNGGNSQIISGSATPTFVNLTDANNVQSVQFSANINVSGTLTIGNAGQTSANFLTSTNTLQVNSAGAAGTITGYGMVRVNRNTANAFATQYQFSTYTLTHLTVYYNGSSASGQAITNTTYGSAGSGGLMTQGTLNSLDQTATVAGSFIATSGIFAPASGTITMNDGSSLTTDANTVFQALTIANSATVTCTSSFQVVGILTIGTGGIFAPTAGTITFIGGSIVNNGGAAANLVFYNLTSSGAVSNSTSFNVANDFKITASTFASSGTPTYTVSGSVDFTGGAFTAGGSTLVLNAGSGSKNVTVNGQTLNNIDFNGAGTFVLQDTLATSGYFKITNGTVNATNRTLNIAGDFNRAGGTFTTTGSTVNLTGAGGSTQTISGSTTFNNLSATGSSARTIKYTDGTTQIVGGTWTMTGAAGQLITLTGTSTAGWTINPTAATIDYGDISYSNNNGVSFCATHSQSTNGNNGGSTGWKISSGATCAAPTLAVPTITNNDTGVSVTFNGNITDIGGANATERGFKLYTAADDTCSGTILQNPHDSGSYGTGVFSKPTDSALSLNTSYHYNTYAINPFGTGTSTCETLTTPNIPTVTVSAADGISATAATLHGNITSVGAGIPADNVNPTERGFKIYTNDTCTSTVLQNPHENNYSGGYSTGVYSLATTDALSPHTDYWHTAYAISTVGTGASGSCQKFTTIDTTITMSAQAASAITNTSAMMNGTLISAGGVNVTRLGFNLYSNSQNCGGVPAESHQTGSYGDDTVYSLPASDLTPNTHYSYKSYGLDSGNNEVDSPTCKSFVTLAAVPSALTTVSQSWDDTGNPVSVTPNTNGNPAGTNYFIQYKEIAATDPTPQTTCDDSAGWAKLNAGDGWVARTNAVPFTDYRTADTYTCYRLKARNGAGTPAETDYSSTSVVALTAPAQPTFAVGVANYAPTITTSSITWDWNDNTAAPTGYRLYNSATNDEVCSATALSGCIQTQSSPGNNLQPNVSYSVKSQAYRGAITGQPSTTQPSAYTAIEEITAVIWNIGETEFTTTKLTAHPENIPSNLTAGTSGIQYCYYHVNQDDSEEFLSCDASWQQNANAKEKSGLSVNDKYKFTIQSQNGDSRTTTTGTAQKYTRANAPITPSHSAIATDSVTWTWNKNSNPAWTEFYANDNSGINSGWVADTGSWVATGGTKTANTQYTLTAKAKNGDNIDTTVIQHSAYTAIQTPTTITVGLITPNSIALNMTDSLTNLNVGSSSIQFEETSPNPKPQGAGGEAFFTPNWPLNPVTTTTTDSGLKGAVSGNTGTTYKYKIKARNAEGAETPQSAEFSFTTTAGTQLLFQLPGETLDENGGTHLLSYSDPTPSNITAGVPFSFMIDAADGANYRDLAHEDTITLSSSDAQAELPAAAAMSSGAITYNNVILKTVGAQTISGSGSAGSSHEVMVVAGICSATVSTATAAPTPLDTGQTSTVTITLKDGFGNALAGHTVSVSSDQGSDNITFSAGATDANGRIFAYVTSALAHVSTITVRDTSDGVTLNAHPQITFNQSSVPVPTDFSVKAGDAKVDLYWTNPAGIDHINIYRSTTSGELGAKIQSTANQSYTDSGLTNGVVYFYTLRSSNAGGVESASTEQLSAQPQSVNPTDNIPPSAPKNLRALKITATELEIAWDASTDNVGVTGYQIYNSDTQVLVGVTTDLTYSFENLTPKTNYHFYVRAYDAAGNYSIFSEILDITTLESKNGEDSIAAYLILGNVPEVADAGKSFKGVRVSVADSGGKIVTDYERPIYFSSTDPDAELPYDQGEYYTFNPQDAGVHEFNMEKFTFNTTGDQRLTVSDNVLSASKSINVQSNIGLEKTASKVRDFFDKPSNVSKVNTGVVATSAAVLLIPILLNSALSASSIIPQLIYWFIQLLQAVGIRRRSKPWGVVFNAQTGQPVALAIVKIFDKQYNRMLEQVVTDSQGRYGFIAKPGEFYMSVSKAGFIFPPKEKSSSFYEKVYFGGNIKISEKDQTVAFNIPLDPIVGQRLAINLMVYLVRFNKLLQHIRIPLLVIGVVFAAVMTITSFNIVYALSLFFYVLVIALEVLRGKKAKPYGTVTDTFGHSIDLAIVRIYRKNTNRLVESDVSDAQGRFKFLVSPGVYYLTAAKPGFIDFKSHLMYLEKERTMVSSTIKLKKVE